MPTCASGSDSHLHIVIIKRGGGEFAPAQQFVTLSTHRQPRGVDLQAGVAGQRPEELDPFEAQRGVPRDAGRQRGQRVRERRGGGVGADVRRRGRRLCENGRAGGTAGKLDAVVETT